jgi:hypothetical protein
MPKTVQPPLRFVGFVNNFSSYIRAFSGKPARSCSTSQQQDKRSLLCPLSLVRRGVRVKRMCHYLLNQFARQSWAWLQQKAFHQRTHRKKTGPTTRLPLCSSGSIQPQHEVARHGKLHATQRAQRAVFEAANDVPEGAAVMAPIHSLAIGNRASKAIGTALVDDHSTAGALVRVVPPLHARIAKREPVTELTLARAHGTHRAPVFEAPHARVLPRGIEAFLAEEPAALATLGGV